MKRGEQAEWCPRCKLNVLPVGTGKQKWVCPTCQAKTKESK